MGRFKLRGGGSGLRSGDSLRGIDQSQQQQSGPTQAEVAIFAGDPVWEVRLVATGQATEIHITAGEPATQLKLQAQEPATTIRLTTGDPVNEIKLQALEPATELRLVAE